MPTVTNSDANLSNNTLLTEEGNFTITGTLTFSTAPVLPADTIDAITEIAAALKSGADGTLITGTAGSDGDLAQWNSDGDLVDGPTPPTGTIVGTSDAQTLTNKTLTSPVLNTGVSGTAVLDEDDLTSDSATQLATQQSIKAYVDAQVGSGTKSILLSMAGAEVDDTNPPEAILANSVMHLAFDASTDEIIYYRFRMPQDYSSGATMKILYTMASATSGSVVWQCDVMAITAGDAADVDSESYDTQNSVQDTVPGTAGHLAAASLTLTNDDSLAANDLVTLRFRRDADGTNGTDNATGDSELRGLTLEYSS